MTKKVVDESMMGGGKRNHILYSTLVMGALFLRVNINNF